MITTKGKLSDIAGSCCGFPDVRHVDCGGALWIDGEGWIELPTGFGYRDGDPRFEVSTRRLKTYRGCCERCRKSGTFIRADKRSTKGRTRHPKLRAVPNA